MECWHILFSLFLTLYLVGACHMETTSWFGHYSIIFFRLLIDLIIIDKDSGTSRGYGFITFTNPRAATKAINNMNGASLEGRMIRVNEVTTRTENRFGRDYNRFVGARDRGRGRDNHDFRFRDRSGNARQFSPSRNRRLSPYHSDRGRLPVHKRSHSPQGGRSLSRSASPVGRQDNHRSVSPSPRSFERLSSAEEAHKRRDKWSKKAVKNREEALIKVKEDLEKSNQRCNELRIQVASAEELHTSKILELTELQNKCKKLEDSLTTVVAAHCQKQNLLLKLQRAFLQVRSSSEQLQTRENELQVLIDNVAREASINGSEVEGKRGRKPGPESDAEWREEEDVGPVNIDD